MASAGAGTAGAGIAPAELCPEVSTPRLTSGSTLELDFQLMLQGNPFVFGEDNAVTTGGTVTPLGVRFYVSEVALERANADAVPVDIVMANGAPAPYGVYFFNAESATPEPLRLLSPPGDYTAITFLLGLTQPCNTRSAEESKAPLSATSTMTWPHTGYLFLRYEGRFTPSGGGEPSTGLPPAIHMGGNLFEALAPKVYLEGTFSMPAAGTVAKNVHFAMEEVFDGAMANVDLTGFFGPPGEEVVAGERLRRSMPELNIFTFGQ